MPVPHRRWVVVAIDHPLYSWPCRGLESERTIIRTAAAAGADAIIASYGTIRDHRDDFGPAQPILKLDLTTVSLHGAYPSSEFVQAWTVDDALRLGVEMVLTYVQLGAPFELEALRTAGRVAAAADAAGLTYVCEIMPVESSLFPDAEAPEAIAAAVRVGTELGGHIIKTTLPSPPEALSLAIGRVPVIVAGGNLSSERDQLLEGVRQSIDAGGSGVAFGRNVWGNDDPAGMISSLRSIVHAGDLVTAGAPV